VSDSDAQARRHADLAYLGWHWGAAYEITYRLGSTRPPAGTTAPRSARTAPPPCSTRSATITPPGRSPGAGRDGRISSHDEDHHFPRGASGPLIRFADDDGAVEEAAVAELAGSGRLRLQPRGTGGHPGTQVGLAGLPPETVERARWWEAHIIEVVDGTRPDAPAGTPPRPAYDVERTSLRERERAKAAELSAPGRPVAASTVKHRRQRWQAEGLPGLVDRRVARRRSPAGRADPAVAEAMEQAIAEATDESSRTATFIVWRTRQMLAERGQASREPSRATMFRLFSRLSAGRHAASGDIKVKNLHEHHSLRNEGAGVPETAKLSDGASPSVWQRVCDIRSYE
jgi:hypothetical protein